MNLCRKLLRAVLVAFFVFSAGISWGAVHVVADGTPPIDGTFTDIQNAINGASPGDTIKVKGTYIVDTTTPEIVVDKSLILKGVLYLYDDPDDDPDMGPKFFPAVLDRQDQGAVCIRVTADNVVIKGFEIRNGSVGIRAQGADNLLVRDCFIHDNLKGLRVTASDNCRINYNVIFNNSTYGIEASAADATLNHWGCRYFDGDRLYTLYPWGDRSGPLALDNLDGMGDEVTEGVNYRPWIEGQVDEWPDVVMTDWYASAGFSSARRSEFNKTDEIVYYMDFWVLGPPSKYNAIAKAMPDFGDGCTDKQKDKLAVKQGKGYSVVLDNDQTIPCCSRTGYDPIAYKVLLKRDGIDVASNQQASTILVRQGSSNYDVYWTNSGVPGNGEVVLVGTHAEAFFVGDRFEISGAPAINGVYTVASATNDNLSSFCSPSAVDVTVISVEEAVADDYCLGSGERAIVSHTNCQQPGAAQANFTWNSIAPYTVVFEDTTTGGSPTKKEWDFDFQTGNFCDDTDFCCTCDSRPCGTLENPQFDKCGCDPANFHPGFTYPLGDIIGTPEEEPDYCGAPWNGIIDVKLKVTDCDGTVTTKTKTITLPCP